MRKCQKCGHEISDEMLFCPECGNVLKEEKTEKEESVVIPYIKKYGKIIFKLLMKIQRLKLELK